MKSFSVNSKVSILKSTRRKGSAAVLTGLAMVPLLGFAAISVDYGLLTIDANRLQRACDAAALAGSAELKKTGNDTTDSYNAKVVAQNVAYRNGVSVTHDKITIVNSNREINVQGAYRRSFFFAPILGIKNGMVTRSARAGVAPTGKISTGGPIRVAPIGISEDTFNAYNNDRTNYHDLTLVRQNKNTFGLDDFVLFDLRNTNAKSPAFMADQLKGTNVQFAEVGESETTLNANQAAQNNHLEPALDYLFDESAESTWGDSDETGNLYNAIVNGTASRSNPRVVYLIVTPKTNIPNNGTFDAEIKGFVPVYIESYYVPTATTGKGKNKGNNSATDDALRLRVRFLPPGEVSGDDTEPADGDDGFYGARTLTLLG